MEEAQSVASKAFKEGEKAVIEKYANKALKFKDRGFKHGWRKALAGAQVSLDVPIPFEQEDIEPLEADLK